MTADAAPQPDPEPLVEQLRAHAGFCAASGAPLYAELMTGMAQDLEVGGPTAEVFAGHERPPVGDVLQLRMLGGLHRIVLTRRAPLLATYYRSVGGEAAPDGAWGVARDVVAAHVDELREALAVPPQTNEPGRAAALAVGLQAAALVHGRTDVRLLEVGASAGLNLNVDRFRVTAADGDPAHVWGPADSPVDLTGSVLGGWPPPVDGLRVVERRGCDLAPVDACSAEGRLRLTSFVWPDHAERHRRLAGALALAAEHPVVVDRADAVAWLRDRLREAAADGVLTVVWHSVFVQYLDDATRSALWSAVDDASVRMPVAHLSLEAPRAPYMGSPTLMLDGAVLGGAPAHGVPLTIAS
ncbi:DUF2332 domain-containing protein [Kineosporia sp. A_224]|uniref:DUF2332 domain-containing protein n=1 Tax=Kineosporia sp. A_224 TaxID=1962180 RepID=UPI0013044961|nr:DUF2332 domain-containing protein [Kineosporia sp. A_224]